MWIISPGLQAGSVVRMGICLLPVPEYAIRGKAKQMGMAEKAETFSWWFITLLTWQNAKYILAWYFNMYEQCIA